MDENRQLTVKPGTTDIRERTKLAANELMARFRALDSATKRWLSVAAAFILICLIGLIWYGSSPDWRTLYAGLDPQDAREMASELTAAGIPFDVSSDGTSLRVGADHLDKARLVTTAKGGPRSGRMGFELFDKPNWVGSEFDEKVNYQRALEGELEHTIGTLSDVENARVHLVMPHDSLFTDQQREAKASVVLKLRRRTLPDQEADSIRNLVASAVDDLHPENVVLLDAQGRQLGHKGGSAEMEAHEQELAAKLIETLEPIAGAGNVRASVNVEYDSSTADEVVETYDPNDVVTLSMQRSEQTTGGQPMAAGVPGTASNAPNVQPPVYPKSVSDTENIKQESGTYGASKKVRHTVQGSGKVRRITAAILINHRMLVNGKQVSWQPRSSEEMGRIAELAQAAVGFDAARGDVVSVEDMAFEDRSEPESALGERLLKTATESAGLLRYGAVMLAMLLLLLFVVRPVMAKLKPAVLLQAQAVASPALALGDDTAQLSPEQLTAEKHKLQAQAIFEHVTDHLRRDPVQSTRLLQSWIHTQ
jgi:flagellar M-ring protein FliF